MEARRQLRRMPQGERCPECGSQKCYIQDGLRFCSKGHQIEGFVQFDVGEEEETGRMGNVARRQKEVRVTEKRQLTGRDGKLLYLEAVQLLLRTQVQWLVREKGYRDELETVVRDLWDLRTRGSSALESSIDDVAETQLEMFSSQPMPEDPKAPWKRRTRARSWDPERGADWPMPRLPETVALCYLGCLLLKSPMGLGELLQWVNRGKLPYRMAFHDLPREMQHRMPSPYVKVLKSPLRSGLGGQDLYRTAMDLVVSYRLNYDMVFPEVNFVSLLVQYAQALALPVESVVTAKRLAASLECRFDFPAGGLRIQSLHYPEIHIAALLVVATKLCFPFDSHKTSLLALGTVSMPRFDWECWKRDHVETAVGGGLGRNDAKFSDVTPYQVVKMSDGELEEYLSHVAGFIDKTNDNPITSFFPPPPTPRPAEDDGHVPDVDVFEKACLTLSQALKPAHRSRSEPGDSTYEAFRRVEDLSETATSFYKATGDATGVPLHVVVQAVYGLEQRIVSWQKRQVATEYQR